MVPSVGVHSIVLRAVQLNMLYSGVCLELLKAMLRYLMSEMELRMSVMKLLLPAPSELSE